jgi:hypothetical protein
VGGGCRRLVCGVYADEWVQSSSRFHRAHRVARVSFWSCASGRAGEDCRCLTLAFCCCQLHSSRHLRALAPVVACVGTPVVAWGWFVHGGWCFVRAEAIIERNRIERYLIPRCERTLCKLAHACSQGRRSELCFEWLFVETLDRVDREGGDWV